MVTDFSVMRTENTSRDVCAYVCGGKGFPGSSNTML